MGCKLKCFFKRKVGSEKLTFKREKFSHGMRIKEPNFQRLCIKHSIFASQIGHEIFDQKIFDQIRNLFDAEVVTICELLRYTIHLNKLTIYEGFA